MRTHFKKKQQQKLRYYDGLRIYTHTHAKMMSQNLREGREW